MDKEFTSKESTSQLREAIYKLEAYSLQQMDPGSSDSKTMSLVRSILTCFDPTPKKHRPQRNPPDKHEVLIAVEWINRNRLFIEQLEKGPPDDQKLAKEIAQAITNYNNCDKRIQDCSGRQRLAQFFLRDKQHDEKLPPKITLLKKIASHQPYPEHLSPKNIHKIAANAAFTGSISEQWLALYRMKAIALLERSGIASSQEARAFVKKSPIHTIVQENICVLTQTFTFFPEQIVVIKGDFALDPKTQAISRLFPETFCLSLESTQTGFPHPIQRAGWTLASQLLPEFPQRIDLLDNLAGLIKQKNLIVTELSKQGALLKHAKELLSLKKKCFSMHAKELINLQKKLHYSILKAAEAAPITYENLDRFFNFLETHPHPFEALSDASQIIRESFLMKPHQFFLDAIIKGKSTGLGSSYAEVRYQASKNLLDHAFKLAKDEIHRQTEETKLLNEKIKLEYIAHLGNILEKGAAQIFLQTISEDVVFPLSPLSSFAGKMQAAAYSHQKDFLEELTISLTGDAIKDEEITLQLLKKQIRSDIAIFQTEAMPAISTELSLYFEKRYRSLSSLLELN